MDAFRGRPACGIKWKLVEERRINRKSRQRERMKRKKEIERRDRDEELGGGRCEKKGLAVEVFKATCRFGFVSRTRNKKREGAKIRCCQEILIFSHQQPVHYARPC
jgi:hypothetical protein